jgi:hypothetical protein
MLRHKGVYPYEYMDSFAKFNELQLPPINSFYSELIEKNISQEEYTHAQKIWQQYQCKTMRDYHDIYLKSDVMLLAEVFENFRQTSLSIYRLDPCHYVTTPGIAWDACLRQTKVELELITEMDMYNFVESGIRGGVATCGEYRNMETGPQSKSEIKYYDVNNLYGKAMCELLPVGEFAWVESPFEFLNTETLAKMEDDPDTGYFLEVDLLYPEHLQHEHNAFPLAPEHMNGKLMLTLYNKSHYIVHVKTLACYVEFGLIVTDCHRILKFKHKAWMKEYIVDNHNRRLEAKEKNNTAQADFFKLMNNAVYGKTMENVKKRKTLKIVRSENDFTKWQRELTYKKHKTFAPDFVVVSYQPGEVTLNKPIYLGLAILDYAKRIMYRYYYGIFKRYFGPEVTLLYTDTDSLIVHLVKGPMWEANYHKFSFHVCDHTLGYIKDEMEDTSITGYVGLKAKSYALQYDEGKSLTKNKGVPYRINAKILDYNKFMEIMQTNSTIFAKFMKITSINHNMYSLLQEKKALDCQDSKRILLSSDDQKSYAYGHSSTLIPTLPPNTGLPNNMEDL